MRDRRAGNSHVAACGKHALRQDYFLVGRNCNRARAGGDGLVDLNRPVGAGDEIAYKRDVARCCGQRPRRRQVAVLGLEVNITGGRCQVFRRQHELRPRNRGYRRGDSELSGQRVQAQAVNVTDRCGCARRRERHLAREIVERA